MKILWKKNSDKNADKDDEWKENNFVAPKSDERVFKKTESENNWLIAGWQ